MRRLTSVAFVLLAGCLAPKHQRPELPVPDAYPAAPAGYAVPAPAATSDLGWEAFFRDDDLRAVIGSALANNRDLRIATLNVDRARALYRIRRADRLPTLGVDASMATTRTLFGPGLTADGTIFRVGASIPAFELDLFGRVANQSESALRDYLATEEGARATRISLVSSVATAWLAERSLAEQLDLAERTVEARLSSQELVARRFEAGAASELELRQAESLVESARASAAALARQRAQAGDALALLVGAPVTPGDATLAADIVAPVPAGLPSDLLAQRPDVRAAEQQLIGANADIGAARAAMFPRISLTASAGTASVSLTGLFSEGSGVWSFVPALTQPIFGFGRNRAAVKVAKVDRDVAVAQYERTIQEAFRDVADALVATGPLDAQVASAERLRAAEARRVELAQQRYDEGISGFLELLDAQRSLFDAERALVQARQLRLTNAVELYAALGGGLE